MASASNSYLDHDYQEGFTEQMHRFTSEFENLKQLLALPPSYESLTECTELINKINQWEIDTIQQVTEIAEQTREKVRHRSNTIGMERFRPQFQRLADQFRAIERTNHVISSDIEQLIIQLNDLKAQLENSLLTTAEIRTIPIDWTNYLQVVIKQQKSRQTHRDIHFDRLTTANARISIKVQDTDWHVLSTSSSNSTCLHYQSPTFNLFGDDRKDRTKCLSILDVNGQQKPILWDFENQYIYDCCWSTFLNRYIILGHDQLYTYDDTEFLTRNSVQLIEIVRPKRKKIEFLRCACSNENLFISYDEQNTSIDEYNLNQWTLIHRYQNIVKQNEIISSIAISETNSNLIGITILSGKNYSRFELRNQIWVLISSIQLDRSVYSRRLISLPNVEMNWLVVHSGSKVFTIIDESGQTSRKIECSENIDLATFFPEKNCLVVKTEKSKLKFFDL